MLNRANLSFPAGSLTFLVGGSGSGKTTLGNLIANLYNPLTGGIQIDTIPYYLIDKEWLQSNITLIDQSSVVFEGTVSYNVALGHRDPNQIQRQEIMMACERTLLQSTIADLPHGYDTLIGRGGHTLSGGQKQKLALARAYIHDPQVLILDEATSELDQESRALMMDAIRSWRENKTTIIITHDLSQIMDNEFVYVMDSGNVVQRGYRKELLKEQSGPFSALLDLMLQDSKPVLHTATERNKHLDIKIAESVSPGRRFSFPPFDASRLSHRMSLGRGIPRFIYSRTEHPTILEQLPHESTSLKSKSSFAEDSWDPSIRFSQYVQRHFTTQGAMDITHPTLKELESSIAEVDRISLAEEDISRYPKKILEYEKDIEPEFVFGAVERRPHIKDLRRSRTLDISHNLTEIVSERPKNNSISSTLRTLWPLLDTTGRLIFILGILSCLIAAATVPAFSYCFAQLLGVMWSSASDRTTQGRIWAAYILGIAVIDGVTTAASRYLLEKTGQTWVTNIRIKALEKILRQDKQWFDKSKHSPGRLSECFDRNAEEMRNIVGRFVPIFVTGAAMVLVSVFWAIAISWELALVALSPLPIFLGSVKGYDFVSGMWEGKCNDSAEEASAVFTDIIGNIRVVRALCLQRFFRSKYKKVAKQTLGIGLRRALYSSVPFGLYESVNYAVTALVFYYGTMLLTREGENTSVSQVLQVVNLLLFGMGTAAGLFASVPQLTMAQATATQMLCYLNLPDMAAKDRGGWKLSTPLPISITDLRFTHEGKSESQLLCGVTLDIDSHDGCIAVVGRSGCGKSTLLSILFGLRSIPTRSPADITPLRFHGMPVDEVDLENLRDQMAYVPQKAFLFPSTLYGNITYGLLPTSPYRQIQHVHAAAEAAGIHDFIMSLPDGYHTVVGDGGQALSGGQAQRVCIARALIRRPKLLVLDEPTSALDAQSANTIQRTIQSLKRQKDVAMVVVTHSREMMRIADRIVVLDEGVVVEEGSYEELLLNEGSFAGLVRSGHWEDRQACEVSGTTL